MKRVGNLWNDVVSFENLHRAAMRALRGKRSRAEACDFVRDLETNLIALQRELASQTWEPGGYRTFWITDPKPRLISAAPFGDRVVHHALIQIIEPVFERRFIHHSYACRVGKGNHRALHQFVKWSRQYKYVLKLDIRKFFPSIDHAVLKNTLRRAIKDPSVLWLLDRIVDRSNPQEPVVAWFEGDDLLSPVERLHGIPIGNLTSQFFGNAVLDPLDHFIAEQLRPSAYLRYVDDLALFGDDKAKLSGLRRAISVCLLQQRFRLNERKSRVRQVKEGIEFLGFVCLPTTLRLSSRNIRTLRRRMAGFRAPSSQGKSDRLAWKRSYTAWCAHAAHGNTGQLRVAISGEKPYDTAPLQEGASCIGTCRK